jgi:hypothetical protein
MLLLLTASAVAALVADDQIHLARMLAKPAPQVLAVLVALLAAAVAAPQISGSRDPVKRHLERTLNWDCGYEPYARPDGMAKLLEMVRESAGDPGVTICLTAEPARSRGTLLRASALHGFIPLLVPIAEPDASGLSLDRVWAGRLSKWRPSFPVPRPYRLFVVVDCADRGIEPGQLQALDHWQRTWPASRVVVLVQPGNFDASEETENRLVKLDDESWTAYTPEDRAAGLSDTLKASGEPRDHADTQMLLASLGDPGASLLSVPLRSRGPRLAWLAGVRAAMPFAPVYAALGVTIAVVLAIRTTASIAHLIMAAVIGLLIGLFLPTALLVLMCGVLLTVSRTVRPVSSRRARLGVAAAGGVAACLFLLPVSGFENWMSQLGLGLSGAVLVYARLTQYARGESLAAFARDHRNELLCALALMVTWEIVSYQSNYPDAAAWTLVIGTIGFLMRTAAQRQSRWALSAAAAALLLVVGLCGLLGPGSLLGSTLPSSTEVLDSSFIVSNFALAIQQLAIAASFLLLAAVVSLGYGGCAPDSIGGLTRWMTVTAGLAVAQPVLALAQQFPASFAGLTENGRTYVPVNLVGPEAWGLAVLGGILVALVLTLAPALFGWRTAQSICALALAIVATTSMIPGALGSQGLIAGVAAPFTGGYGSAPHAGLILLLSLWLALARPSLSLLRLIRTLCLAVLVYLALTFLALLGLLFYTEAQYNGRLTVVSSGRLPVFDMLFGGFSEFGSAAITVLLSFVLLAVIRRFRHYVQRGIQLVRQHAVLSVVILAVFSVSVQQFESSELLIPRVPPPILSWPGLLSALATVGTALILWQLLRWRYGADGIRDLAIGVAALGIFPFQNALMVAAGIFLAILGGPEQSIYRSFGRPGRASLAWGLAIGVSTFSLLSAFTHNILDAVIVASVNCMVTALVKPTTPTRLPNSVVRGNQIRLRQAIYWSTALGSPALLLIFTVITGNFSPQNGWVENVTQGTGWQDGVASLALFFFVLLLLASIGCAWIGAGWWTASRFGAVAWWRGLRQTEDAYGRYYATASEAIPSTDRRPLRPLGEPFTSVALDES